MSALNLRVLGVSHRTAGVELRERLALPAGKLGPAYARLKELGAAEALILSTCNRVEVYTAGPEPLSEEALAGFFTGFQGVDRSALAPHCYALADAGAVRHCFEVVAGLDALALGETQILGQAKEAYCLALEHGMAGPVLNGLFQRAFATAKRLHTETAIGQRKTSVSSVAVDLASSIFQDLSQHAALVIGAGEMSELTVTHLREAGLKRLTVANRTPERAQALAAPFGGMAVPLSAVREALAQADIVISSAGGEGFLISPDDVREALKRRRQRPLFFIDIAVPRNVHPEVSRLDNVYCYDIDDLQKVVAGNLERRAEELTACRAIVDAAVSEALHAHQVRQDLSPLITALRDRLHGIREQEMARISAALSPEARKDAEEAMHRLVNKILHDPIEILKEEAAGGNGIQAAEALRKLFRL